MCSTGTYIAVLRIRIRFLQIRILEFIPNPDPDTGQKHIFSKAITKFWEKFLFSTKKSRYFIKGSVQRKLRPRLLYIIQKLFSWRWATENKIFTFLKGQFAIYIKPLQRICPSPITFAGKCYSPSANCVCGQ